MYYKKAKAIILKDLNEVNTLLKDLKERCFIVFRKKEKEERIGYCAYIWEDLMTLNILARVKNKVNLYKFSLCESVQLVPLTGAEAFNIMSRYYKIQKIEDPDKYGTSSAILYKNPKFNGKRVKAYEYDINSAFAKQMLEPIPDITTLKTFTYVKKGQIGFRTNVSEATGRTILEITFEEGRFCRYVCDLMPSPFKRFVETWYNKKRNAKTPQEKVKAKSVLNYSVGVIQLYNPFLRACIIGRSNAYVSRFIDRNTIYANTDSIVSLTPRPDIEELIGLDIGQWKKEHYGEDFAWSKEKINYQWNLETPVYRGIPKAWFTNFELKKGRKFDILKDHVPDDKNTYVFDYKDLEVKLNYGKKKENN